MRIEYITFKSHGDDRGQLIALEQGNEVPFTTKRVYYIFGTSKGIRRGFHAHKKLKQLLFCVSGSCKIHLDDGRETREVELDGPDKGLLITESLIWREMYDFSENAVLVVLASELYDEKDYIRSYNEFIKYVGDKNNE